MKKEFPSQSPDFGKAQDVRDRIEMADSRRFPAGGAGRRNSNGGRILDTARTCFRTGMPMNH
jgi:hypothetical protein